MYVLPKNFVNKSAPCIVCVTCRYQIRQDFVDIHEGRVDERSDARQVVQHDVPERQPDLESIC
jgi:hypothetical protein